MDKRELFIRYMTDTTNIALATNGENGANMRVVSIGFDQEEPGVVYFITGKDSVKAAELLKSPEVVFVPVPDRPDTDVVIRVRGRAALTKVSIERLAELMGRHLPEFASQMPSMAPVAALFEIRYDAAEMSLGMAPAERIEI